MIFYYGFGYCLLLLLKGKYEFVNYRGGRVKMNWLFREMKEFYRLNGGFIDKGRGRKVFLWKGIDFF